MLGVPDSAELRNLFPSAKQITLGGQVVLAMPHGLPETFILRKLGYQVPSPILTHYDWAGSIAPFDVQRSTCAMLTMNERAYVLNGMGTGKTKAALWAWDYLRSNRFCGKLLVAAPLSTLSFVWVREIMSTLPHRKCAVLHGSKDRRLERLADPDVEIFIINHDGLKVVGEMLATRTDIDVLVIDELAVYRNGKPDRTKEAIKLGARMKWVWGMSGSPMPNSPTDVWAQCKIVTPLRVPKYFTRFRNELMTKLDMFRYVPKPDAVAKAFDVMQPAVRFRLDDVVELPESVERTVDVEMGVHQAKVYKDVAAKCYAAVQNHEITAANAGAAMNKLLQISCGWVYTAAGATVSLDNDARVGALVDNILSAEHKAIVFVSYKHVLAGISKALNKEQIEHACVSGDTSPKERNEIFTAFQVTDKYKVLVAHPTCMSHGLTLTAADTIIWFGPITNNDTFEQATARIRRVGQKHKQLVLHMQATPIEKKIYRMLRSKQSIQSALLELFEGATTQEH
jgi:SNF2 family DNA or RNA helicase